MIFQNEKPSLQIIKEKVKKVEKLTFFQRGYSRILVQNWPFFNLFFCLGNIGQENEFSDTLERKNAFLGYKNKQLKNSKNCHFSSFYCLGNIGQENVFYVILELKKRLSRLYKKEVEKVEKLTFFQRGQSTVLVQNLAISTFFCLDNKGQGNVFYDILELKNAFLGYIKRKLKKAKI